MHQKDFITKVHIIVDLTTHHIFLTEGKTFSSGEINSRLTQTTITKHKGHKHILADRAIPTQCTNQGPNALEYVDALKTQTVESHSHPEKAGTHKTSK